MRLPIRLLSVAAALLLPAAARAHPSTRPVVLGSIDAGRFYTDRPDPKLLPVPEETDAFSFVVFGDRTGGPAEGVEVLAEAVRDANLLGPDLVMTVGDLVQGYNELPEWGEQAAEFKAVMDRLACPWFPVAGNHDVYWRDQDKSGEKRPDGGNERSYEFNFGPLWYAFRHKNSWFVVLYSDEGNPQTGDQTFHDAEAQKMSPQQFEWLRKTLETAKGADHVFVFLHHPRWYGNRTGAEYGDDWERVHKLLAEAGNVSAVFAGHIHHMTYDGPRDGIEYFALATVGGEQSGVVPRAGFLHHYNLVTVRKDSVGMTAIPVGAAIDPRALTLEVVNAAKQLAELRPTVSPPIALAADGSAEGRVTVTLSNPTPFAADVTLTPESRDSHWRFAPDHDHARLAAGQSKSFEFAVRRLAGPADASMDLAAVSVEAEMTTDAARIPIPPARTSLPIDFGKIRGQSPPNRVLALDGESGHVSVPSASLPLPDGPITLEAWMRADDFADRVGLVNKTQGSDYGLFVSKGVPAFMIHVGGGYVTAKGPALEAGRWHHVAGVYDGREVRLYVDGRKVAAKAGSGPRKTNDLPLIVGGDPGGSGRAGSLFHRRDRRGAIVKSRPLRRRRLRAAAPPFGRRRRAAAAELRRADRRVAAGRLAGQAPGPARRRRAARRPRALIEVGRLAGLFVSEPTLHAKIIRPQGPAARLSRDQSNFVGTARNQARNRAADGSENTRRQERFMFTRKTALAAAIAAGSLGLAAAANAAVVITEFMVNPTGTDTEREWLEVYNNGPTAVDMSGYKIGTSETMGDGEDMNQFPAGTMMAAGQTFVIAVQAAPFTDFFGAAADQEVVDTDPAVPDMTAYPTWSGNDTAFLALANGGDQVLLLDGSDAIVDFIDYANVVAPDNTATLVTPGGNESWERRFGDVDTDSASDWVLRADGAATPGVVALSPVPEPTGLALLGVAGLAGLRRRRA